MRALCCFAVLWLICGICFTWRRFEQKALPSDFIADGKVVVDVYAQNDFPYEISGKHVIKPAGERIAKKGETVDEAKAALLKEYGNYLKERNAQAGVRRSRNFLQSLVLLGMLLWCFVFCLYAMRPHFFARTNLMVLCGLLTFLHFGLITWCFIHWQSEGTWNIMQLLSFLPLCLVPALATLLLGTRISICLMLLLTSLTALMLEGEFQFVLFQYSLICSLVGIMLYRKVKRYFQLLLNGCAVILAFLLLDAFIIWHRHLEWGCDDFRIFISNISGVKFWQTWKWTDLTPVMVPSSLYSMLKLALINVGLTTLALFVLPKIFERLFDVVSPITLRGLDEHEHPLLERMHKEASGTYEHCKAVADMAYDAAEAIGADKVLARVAGRFHDIGKLSEPLCFAENCFGAESPHKSMSPYESSDRIRMHVRYGEELGRKYHLPKPIVEAIRTHHGNDVIFYFYNKAKQDAAVKGQPEPSEEAFSYDAPLPHRKEAVIVGIADICEAASRAELLRQDKALDFEEVRQFVNKLIMGKLSHRQLADADMTLAELTIICESMCKSLCIKYHARPKYERAATDESKKPLETSEVNVSAEQMASEESIATQPPEQEEQQVTAGDLQQNSSI